MSDTGFLGGATAPEQPKPVEVPQNVPEVDTYTAEERQAAQEMAAEQQKDTFLEKASEAAPTTTVPVAQQGTDTKATVEAPPVVKDEVTKEVEKILEEGLGDYVPDMPEEARQRFLAKGGEVAGELSGMVRALNVTVKRVVDLIKDWLLTIPGVNRYFIEQEAKIKTDKIVDLVEAHKKEQAP